MPIIQENKRGDLAIKCDGCGDIFTVNTDDDLNECYVGKATCDRTFCDDCAEDEKLFHVCFGGDMCGQCYDA